MHKVLGVVVMLAACSSSETPGDGGDNNNGDDGSVTGDGGGDGGACTAPDMLFLLDRTGTMHRDLSGATPAATAAGYASAKFTIAINALDGLFTTPSLDQTLKFGLGMFPRDPGAGCLTLEQRIQNTTQFSNPSCEVGEIVVPPALGTGAAIASELDPMTTTICNSTPVGAGLETMGAELAARKQPGIEQFVVLVTEGADFAASCPDPDPLAVLRTLDAAGVKTFIVGFGAQDATPQGVNPPVLNQLACAGHTARDFDANCVQVAGGGYDAVNPNGPRLYHDAADAAALQTALRTVASTVCCGCVL